MVLVKLGFPLILVIFANLFSFLQNFPGHVFIRSTPVGTAGSPVPNTSQSLQSPNQLWLSSASQGKPPLPSPSYRPQMNSPSLQQRSHIPPQHHSPPTTSQQQHMSPAQPQQPLQSHQQPEHYGQQFPPSRVQQSLSPLQQVSRVQGSVNHKPSSLAMSHPNTVQPLPQNSIANAESDESGNRILSKRSIHELVSQVPYLSPFSIRPPFKNLYLTIIILIYEYIYQDKGRIWFHFKCFDSSIHILFLA